MNGPTASMPVLSAAPRLSFLCPAPGAIYRPCLPVADTRGAAPG